MSRIEDIQKAVEQYRRQLASDLPSGLVEAIIAAQDTHSEAPVACAAAIDALVDNHLGSGDRDD